jgi:type I restriction enzyme S subunit
MSTTAQNTTPVDVTPDSDLPEGWVLCTLGDVSYLVTSGSRDWSKFYSDRGAYFVRSAEINDYTLRLSEAIRVALPAKIEGKRSLIERDDILVTITGANVGKCAKVEMNIPEAYVSQSVALVKLKEKRLAPVVYYALRAPNVGGPQLSEMAYGLGRPVLSLPQISSIRVPLPPLAEQPRIVAKVEELLQKVNASRSSLAKVHLILKRFRQAVLAGACSGRLTEDWRESRAERGETDAQALVETELPVGWKQVGLGSIADLASGAGFPEKYQNKRGLPYPFFKVGNLGEVESGTLLMESKHTIDDRLVRELRARVVPTKSIVFAKIGMAIALNRRRLLGRPACIDNNMMAAIPTDAVVPTYLLRFLETIDFMPLTQATTVPSIRKSSLAELPVSLPPKDEQKEIVRRVEALFKLADTIEKRVEAATKRADRLTQAVLAKAFRGELVPTEAELARREGRSYEPASALLARIRAERQAKEISKSANGRPREEKKARR